MLACCVDEPARVTPAQMERSASDFENWTPRREEFVRRAIGSARTRYAISFASRSVRRSRSAAAESLTGRSIARFSPALRLRRAPVPDGSPRTV